MVLKKQVVSPSVHEYGTKEPPTRVRKSPCPSSHSHGPTHFCELPTRAGCDTRMPTQTHFYMIPPPSFLHNCIEMKEAASLCSPPGASGGPSRTESAQTHNCSKHISFPAWSKALSAHLTVKKMENSVPISGI